MRYLLAQQFRIYSKNKNRIVPFSGNIELCSHIVKKKIICSICATQKFCLSEIQYIAIILQLLNFSLC